MKRFLTALAVSALFLPAFAEIHPNNLSSDSVAPSMDSIILGQVKAHLDQIRKKENRPTVALVLCGGGAKGAAEVGAMKLIEDMDIPIDFICGTSIGSLLGGLYAVGYDADFLDSLFRHQDWKKMLSDKIGAEFTPRHTKIYKSRYALSVPFHYEKEVLEQREREYEVYSSRDGKIHLDEKTIGLKDPSSFNPLLSSLPSGYVYGFNVNNKFSALTVGYQDSLSFARLPIPFLCVATELVSCKAKHWGSGELKTAMRSSMGIPGLFTPVRTQAMVLSDGGTRNNFPVDLAKAVGADIVIGIDLTNPLPPYAKINNIGTVMGQFVNMLVGANHDDLVNMTDVYIKPELDGFTSLSFKPEAVDSLIGNGYRCALQHEDELLVIKKRTGGAKTKLYGKKAVNIEKQSVRLSSITFSGMNENESRILQKKIGIDITEAVNATDLEKAASIIQGSGTVESVTYSLLGTEEPYDLVFECAKSPVNRLGIGARLDTELWAEIGANFGWNVNKLSGPKLNIDLKLGMSQSLDVHFKLDLPNVPTLNLEVYGANINGKLLQMKSSFFETTDADAGFDALKIDMGYLTHKEQLFITLNDFDNFESRIGIRNTGYYLNSSKLGSMVLLPPESGIVRGNYLGAFIGGNYYNLDNHYTPKKGIDMSIGLDIDFMKYGVRSFRPIYSFSFDIKGVINMGRRVALIPDLHLRNVFDEFNYAKLIIDEYKPGQYKVGYTQEFSFAHRNYLGGDIAGKYISQQVPFVGFGYIMDCTQTEADGSIRAYDHLAVLNLDLRVNAYNNLYISALGGYAHMSQDFTGLFTYNDCNDIFGAGIQLMYQTIIGPIKLRASWSNRNVAFKDNLSFYLSFGLNL